MRLLILTQYYPPEIGAPQNRLHELAVRLKKSGIEVEVLTAMPNYPSMEIQEAYRKGDIREEIIDGIKVYRAKIYVSQSKSIVSRLMNYFSFVFTSWVRGRKLGHYDYLMVESPPLFLGYSAMAISRKLKAKMIFNVSDLWPESAEKLDLVTNKMLLKLAYNLEEKCYRRATFVTGQTNGIVQNIKERFPQTKVHWLPNGVDLSYYDPEHVSVDGFRQRNGFKSDDFLLFYGGIIGYAQGLDVILEAANILRENQKIQFILQGAGPEKERLLALKQELDLTNVHFLSPVQKAEMPAVLKDVDAAVVPLRKLELFQGAIPSKIFEALSMEKPLILGVQGEAHVHFIEKANAGLSFEPENAFSLAEAVKTLAEDMELTKQLGANGRKYVNQHFNRNSIAEKFIGVLRSN